MPSSSAARTRCRPIGTRAENVSPDRLVPIMRSSKNQNIFISGMSVAARKAISALPELSTITVRVLSDGDIITGGVRVLAIASKSHPGR